MPRNVEIKAVVRDLTSIIKAAKALSGSDATIIEQEDTFFFAPNGRLKLRQLKVLHCLECIFSIIHDLFINSILTVLGLTGSTHLLQSTRWEGREAERLQHHGDRQPATAEGQSTQTADNTVLKTRHCIRVPCR